MSEQLHPQPIHHNLTLAQAKKRKLGQPCALYIHDYQHGLFLSVCEYLQAFPAVADGLVAPEMPIWWLMLTATTTAWPAS